MCIRKVGALGLSVLLFLVTPVSGQHRRLNRDDMAPFREQARTDPTASTATPTGPSLDRLIEERDLKRLGAARFPLPDGDFSREMDALARVVQGILTHPDELRYPNGKPDPLERQWNVWRLVTSWQHPAFRGPLLALLRDSPKNRYYAADALLRYQDPKLRDEVERYRDFDHLEMETADSGLMLNIGRDLLSRQGPVSGEESPFEKLKHRSLEFDPYSPKWQEGITLAEGLRALDSGDATIRFLAWVWLVDQGIYPPTGPAREAWPSLSDEQQSNIVRSGNDLFLGAKRKKDLLDQLFRSGEARPGGKLESALLEQLGGVGNPAARRRIKEIILEKVPALGPKDDDLFSADAGLRIALSAFSRSPREDDLECLLVLNSSDNHGVREEALLGLVEIQSPRAIPALRRAILEAGEHELFFAMHAMADIGRQYPETKVRWDFLGILAEGLRQRKREWFLYPNLIDAFSELAGKDFGENGRTFPLGLDEKKMKEAAARCLAWYEENSPRKGL
jgi:hypothetical protein